MNLDFTQIMSQRSDSELLEILSKTRDDYLPEAIAAAEAELKKRNLSVDEIGSANQEIKKKHEVLKEKADEPLGSSWKILTFLLPGLVALLISGALKAGGYERKSTELEKWTFWGIAFYVIVALLILLCVTFGIRLT